MTNRVKKLQEMLTDGEAVLIENGANRLYFTGFHSSAGCVFVSKDKAVFLIDFRYFEKAKQVVTSCEVVLSSRSLDEIKNLAEISSVKRIYIETRSASVERFNQLKNAFEGIEVSFDCKIDDAITKMRSIKSAEELSYIKQAQEMTDKTFSYILNNIKAGRTER